MIAMVLWAIVGAAQVDPTSQEFEIQKIQLCSPIPLSMGGEHALAGPNALDGALPCRGQPRKVVPWDEFLVARPELLIKTHSSPWRWILTGVFGAGFFGASVYALAELRSREPGESAKLPVLGMALMGGTAMAAMLSFLYLGPDGVAPPDVIAEATRQNEALRLQWGLASSTASAKQTALQDAPVADTNPVYSPSRKSGLSGRELVLFDERFLRIHTEIVRVTSFSKGGPGQASSSSTQLVPVYYPVKGVGEAKLPWLDFFHLTQAHEQIAVIEARRRVSWGLLIGGVSALALGVLAVTQSDNTLVATGGVGLASAGVGSVIAAPFVRSIRPPAIEVAEALAQNYNNQLSQQLVLDTLPTKTPEVPVAEEVALPVDEAPLPTAPEQAVIDG